MLVYIILQHQVFVNIVCHNSFDIFLLLFFRCVLLCLSHKDMRSAWIHPAASPLYLRYFCQKRGLFVFTKKNRVSITEIRYEHSIWRGVMKKMQSQIPMRTWTNRSILPVKYSAHAECEIMCCRTLWNFPLVRKVKWNTPHRRSDFTRRRRISRPQGISQIPQGIYFVEKSTPKRAFFWCEYR